MPNHNDVRVLLAEDSATIRRYLTDLIDNTPGLRVVGTAEHGEAALALVAELRPDVVSMDIRMPKLDGLEATRRIMAQYPTPVVVVSGLVERDVELSFQALDAGALAVVEKPPNRDHPAFQQKYRRLIRTLVAMSKVSVVRRGGTARLFADETIEIPLARQTRAMPEVVAIGASAGGPSALNRLLSGFPADMRVPVVIVQHIPDEFIQGLARWLDKSTPLYVQVAEDGTLLEPGNVYLAPGKAHLRVIQRGGRLVVRLDTVRGDYRYYPSVDVLFESIAQTCGMSAIGVVLTGMGDDGAEGLLAMRRAGARTFAQDQKTSTVYGMPAAAVEKRAVEQVLPLAHLSTAIAKLM